MIIKFLEHSDLVGHSLTYLIFKEVNFPLIHRNNEAYQNILKQIQNPSKDLAANIWKYLYLAQGYEKAEQYCSKFKFVHPTYLYLAIIKKDLAILKRELDKNIIQTRPALFVALCTKGLSISDHLESYHLICQYFSEDERIYFNGELAAMLDLDSAILPLLKIASSFFPK